MRKSKKTQRKARTLRAQSKPGTLTHLTQGLSELEESYQREQRAELESNDDEPEPLDHIIGGEKIPMEAEIETGAETVAQARIRRNPED